VVPAYLHRIFNEAAYVYRRTSKMAAGNLKSIFIETKTFLGKVVGVFHHV
jgi:hypothetical protein